MRAVCVRWAQCVWECDRRAMGAVEPESDAMWSQWECAGVRCAQCVWECAGGAMRVRVGECAVRAVRVWECAGVR